MGLCPEKSYAGFQNCWAKGEIIDSTLKLCQHCFYDFVIKYLF